MPEIALLGGAAELEEAWRAYTMSEATGWQHLPYSGGLLDQPDILISNLYRIKNHVDALRKLAKVPKPEGEHAAE